MYRDGCPTQDFCSGLLVSLASLNIILLDMLQIQSHTSDSSHSPSYRMSQCPVSTRVRQLTSAREQVVPGAALVNF